MSKWPGTVIDDEELYAAQSTGGMPAQQQAAPAASTAPPTDMAFPGAEVEPSDPRLVDGGYAEIGGFADELPRQAASQMAPEDEAAIRDMLLRGADDSEITEFAASKGFRMTNLDAVRKALTQTGNVNKNTLYELPTVALPEEDRTTAATARGAADTVTFGTLPKLGAAVGATVDWLNDDASFAEAYNRHLDENNGVIQGDERDHPYARIAGQLAGAVVLPAGIEGVGFRAGSQVLRAGGTISEARAAAAAAVRNRLAAVGGAYGAAHGAGSGDTIGEAVTGAVTEGAIGAAGGLLAGAAGEVIAPRMAARAANTRGAPVSEGRRVAAAAERQGVDVLPADVGGPTTRRLTSAAAQAPVSAAPIINAGQRAVEQSAAVRDRVAQSVGQALNPEAAGEMGVRGARAFIARTSQRANTLYRAAETQANGVTIQPTSALAALNRNIRELRDTPGGAAGLARLEGLRDALQQGQFSAQGVRRMRTALRDEFIEAGLRGSDIERRVNQVVDAANDDIANSLTQAGRPNAAKAFRVADRYWRNRIKTIDDNLAPIIGKEGDASGEQVVQRLTAAMNGNNARFSAFISALPAEEQTAVRASLIARIGRSTSGAQNDTGDAFSLATFLTNWDKIGETAKARLLTPEGRAAMNDLATIASGARQTAGYANRSNTSGGIWGNLGVAGGVAAASPLAAISGLIAQYGAGRLLSSPRLTRWLARSTTTRVPATEYVARLSRIAKAEPAIANDILSLQARFAEAFTSNAPARLAAEEGDDEPGVINGQNGNRQTPTEGAQP